MNKKRLVLPTWKQMKKWFWASLSREDRELDYYQYSRRSGTVRIYLDDVLQTGTDPEHAPPQSTWEKIGDNFRRGFHFFGSPESVFGFRVAVATMTVSLVAFLRNSQHFYIQQRLIWGSIMIAISMASTVGSAIYGQSMRLLGTTIGMVMSYIDWYIVDQQPAGVLVFVGITMFLSHYPLIRFPNHAVPPPSPTGKHITLSTYCRLIDSLLLLAASGLLFFSHISPPRPQSKTASDEILRLFCIFSHITTALCTRRTPY
jgi:hypothetical protein